MLSIILTKIYYLYTYGYKYVYIVLLYSALFDLLSIKNRISSLIYKYMSKKAVGVVLVLVVIALAIVLNQSVDDKKVIKIGVIAPLTGPGATFGNSLVKALELAQKDLTDTKYAYELVIEDDASNPTTAASAAQKLVQIDGVKAIISATSGTGNAIAPIIEAAKIPMICTACADKKVGVGNYSYTSSVQAEDEAEVFMDYAQLQGATSVGLLNQIHPGINTVADALKTEALSRNMTIVFEERFDGSNRDFKTIVKKAAAAKADVYFLQSFPPSLDIIGQEFATLNVANIASAAGAYSVAAEPKIFEGKWYTESLSDPEFTVRFQKEFPDIRFNIRTGPYGYDAFMMFVQGFEQDADMAVYLKNLNEYKGKVGRLYKTDGNYFRSKPGVWVIENGKPRVVSE